MALRHSVNYSQYRGHQQITAPSIEPVTVQDMTDQLNLDVSGQSSYIDLLIKAAREQAEEVTGLALITQTWQLTLDNWPTGDTPWWNGTRQMAVTELYSNARASWVILPRYPLQSVSSVKTYDATGNSSSLTVSDVFIVDTQQQPGRMVLKYGETWPTALQNANAIEIEYSAGYGSSASDVPSALRLAIMQMVAHQFEHRGDGCSTEDAMTKSGAKSTFERFRSRGL